MYSRSTEIRHLSSADIYKLSQILEPRQSWKKLMRILPKDLFTEDETHELKYNNDHIQLTECASVQFNRSCTEILIDEWGCSGRKRPTVGKLLDLLVKAELFRAADFVAENFLNEPPPERPTTGPAAKVDISLPPLESTEIHEIENILENVSYPGTTTLKENERAESNINKDYYEKLGQNKKLDIAQSDLMKFSSDSGNIPNLSDLRFTSTVTTDVIPAISALNVEILGDTLPNLTALNIEDDKMDTKIEDKIADVSMSSTASSKNDSSLTPNLSIFEQNNLNDSSLTHVTDTSEENILFESKESDVSENIPCLSALNNM